MAFIDTIPPGEASGAVLDMYRRQQDHWGYVPDYAKVFSHRPEALARWGQLLAEIRRPMDDRRFELVTLVVALELRHSACSLAHGKKLAELIGEDAVIAIAGGRKADALSTADFAIAEFARDIARDARKITHGRVEALKSIHGLTDEEVFDVVATAAARCFFTKVLDALGSEPDSAFMSMSPALRQALTVGRPVSPRKPEYTAAVA
ncbi:MAG: hypothetical protein WB812_01555 [Woeseiaceae bacterium]